MSLQVTSLGRSREGITQAPYCYKGQIENLLFDGKLEDIVCQRLDAADSSQTQSIIRDANALKAFFMDPAVAAARSRLDKNSFTDTELDLGSGPQSFRVTKMPSGDYRFVNMEDPGGDVSAQVVLMQGGEHPHRVMLSTRVPGCAKNEPDLLQKITMTFTGSQKFLVDGEELSVGEASQDSKAPHVPDWDIKPGFQNVRPFSY